jgi:hypothetical protein
VDNTLGLHVTDDFNHLGEEVSAIIFAHASHCLAQIEEKTSVNVLEENINKVVNFSA